MDKVSGEEGKLSSGDDWIRSIFPNLCAAASMIR